jgi:hypothetical protein
MAKLKFIIDELIQVPGPDREFYTQTADGKFALDVEGEPPGYVKAEKLNEFRESNRAMHSKLKAFEGIDPATIAAERAKWAELEKKFEGIDPDEYRVLKARPEVAPEVTELRAALATAQADKATAQQAADAALFKSHIAAAFLPIGGEPQALDYVISLAQRVFKVDNGQLVAGEYSVDRPGERMSVAEWMGSQLTQSAFAFKPSGGGGASHTSGPPIRHTISNDPREFGRNIEGIASGKVHVQS